MSNSRDSWVKNYAEVDFDVAFLSYPSSGHLEEQEQERMLDSTLSDSTPSSSNSSPEPQHPLIAGASPSAPPTDVVPAQPRQSHGRPIFTLTDTPVTQSASAPPTVRARPSSNLLESVPPPSSSDTSNAITVTARSPRSSFKSFPSSPLNPTSPAFQSPFARPASRASAHIHRIPSEDCRALSIGGSPLSLSTAGSRASMILYKLPGVDDAVLLPPTLPRNSISGESIVSLSSDSKYPSSMMTERGLIAYAYDPSKDEDMEDDMQDTMEWKHEGSTLSWRGFINVTALVALISALLCLFIVYPVYRAFTDTGVNEKITRNIVINATGQADPASLNARATWEFDLRL